MPKRLVTLELSPAEARALLVTLDNTLAVWRELGPLMDEWPADVTRLERVQRLVADGLNYLEPVRPA